MTRRRVLASSLHNRADRDGLLKMKTYSVTNCEPVPVGGGAVFELLREGQRVEFTPEESQKGPRAGDVRLVES